MTGREQVLAVAADDHRAWPAADDGEVRRVARVPLSEVDFRVYCEYEILTVPTRWETHVHEVDELLCCTHGVLSVVAGDRWWTVPQGSGVWIPAQVEHRAQAGAGAGYCAAYVVPVAAGRPRTPVGVRVSRLLSELLLFLSRPDAEPAVRRRAEDLAFDLIEPDQNSVGVAMPRDARILPIAQALVADPADERDLVVWAAEVGLSPRTVERVFVDATGMTFGRWRRTVRMHAAAALLADGVLVSEVAALVGYASPSAFIAAFRRTTGRTPRALAGDSNHR